MTTLIYFCDSNTKEYILYDCNDDVLLGAAISSAWITISTPEIYCGNLFITYGKYPDQYSLAGILNSVDPTYFVPKTPLEQYAQQWIINALFDHIQPKLDEI